MNKPAPFNRKQKIYLKNTFHSWFNVIEGGKRGSKNVLNTYCFCVNLETHPDKFHLIAGVDQASARINIGDCNGFGLFNYYEGRYRVGKYENRDCYYIQTKAGEKVVFFAGGKKKGSENDIHGYTYGMAYVTEANLCYKGFLQEVFDRTVSSSNRKVFHDFNPLEADHWYYTDILNFHEKQQKLDDTYGFNYLHTTLVDNGSLSDDKIRDILKTYDKDSLWYRRDIKGGRERAEGLVFPYFADNIDNYIFDEKAMFKEGVGLVERFTRFIMGVDFGDNGSVYSFTFTGFKNNWYDLRVLEEYSIPKGNEISSRTLSIEFVKFYKNCMLKWGYPEWIFCDSASNTLINTLREAAQEAGLPYTNIAPVKKNELSERPEMVDYLLVTGRLLINKRCKNLINALKNLVWDEKKPNIPEDENKGNINDYWDSFCYTFITHEGYINLRR